VCIPSFVNIGLAIQKGIGGFTNRELGARVSRLSFLSE
jgi:hypothetical protein